MVVGAVIMAVEMSVVVMAMMPAVMMMAVMMVTMMMAVAVMARLRAARGDAGNQYDGRGDRGENGFAKRHGSSFKFWRQGICSDSPKPMVVVIG